MSNRVERAHALRRERIVAAADKWLRSRRRARPEPKPQPKPKPVTSYDDWDEFDRVNAELEDTLEFVRARRDGHRL